MSTLSELGSLYGTDKGNVHHSFCGESYLDIYDRYFHRFRHGARRVVEIGVKSGASLRMWKDYFPGAHIYGIDIDPSCRRAVDERIAIYTMSQDSPALTAAIPGVIDVVIDDGSHVTDLTIASFGLLWPKVQPGGFYAIEDLATSYLDLTDHVPKWPGMQYNKSMDLRERRVVMDDFLLEKIKAMDHQRGNIKAIHFHSQLVIMEKA